METLKAIVDDAVADLKDVLSDDQVAQITKVIEAAAIRGMLEGQHRAVDACIHISGPERDMAHKIATEIRKKNDVLIANLSAMR